MYELADGISIEGCVHCENKPKLTTILTLTKKNVGHPRAILQMLRCEGKNCPNGNFEAEERLLSDPSPDHVDCLYWAENESRDIYRYAYIFKSLIYKWNLRQESLRWSWIK